MSEKQVIFDVGDGAVFPRPEDKGLLSAWWLSFVGTLAVSPISGSSSFYLIIVVTFQVTIAFICLALILGLLAGLGRISRNRIVNLVASTYVEVIRGIPLLVQLFCPGAVLCGFRIWWQQSLPWASVMWCLYGRGIQGRDHVH